jgi:hypothetical protein
MYMGSSWNRVGEVGHFLGGKSLCIKGFKGIDLG